ncbi:MAG: hypothetical protein U0R80_14790 [Nocardioidaceae bacterium]
MKTRQRWAAAVLAGGLLLGSAACGGKDTGSKDSGSDAADSSAAEDFAGQSGKEIKDAVVADMKELDSLAMSAEVNANGQAIQLDLAMDTDGQCVGTVGMQGGTAQIMSVGGDLYMKGDEDFWKATAGDQADAVIALIGDRWAKQAGTGGFGSFCDLDGLLSSFEDDGSDSEDPTVGDVEDLDGQQAVKLSSKDSSGDDVAVWVSAEDPHYILKLETSSASDPGTVTLSDFNEPVDVEAPAEDEYVDLSSLS